MRYRHSFMRARRLLKFYVSWNGVCRVVGEVSEVSGFALLFFFSSEEGTIS
jgi:hypothetical protein